ncbi:MAG: hypothetical protein HOW73_09180 [Polyangiaceae bacterium]|nr:hypothetical protein [Polyangiaceae bacterium]
MSARSTNVPLRCACGELRGVALDVTSKAGTRVLCYCDDCQKFATYLGHPGVVDQWGGTDIFQMAPSQVRLDRSRTLRAVRLTDKGLFRWHCAECKTPVGNMVGPRVPFVGVVHSVMDHEATGRTRDELLGPAALIQTKFAIGQGAPKDAGVLGVIARASVNMAGWWVRGATSPSAFFDGKTPRAPVEVLSSKLPG